MRVLGSVSPPGVLFSVSATEEIRQTLFSELRVSTGGESEASVPALFLRRFPLGWSHYITLLSVTDPDARRFYEIEAAENGWSVRELKRQLGSSLYERLALSRDKGEVRRLAREKQVVEKACSACAAVGSGDGRFAPTLDPRYNSAHTHAPPRDGGTIVMYRRWIVAPVAPSSAAPTLGLHPRGR